MNFPPPTHTPGDDAQKVVPSELLTEYFAGAAKVTGHTQPRWEKVLELQRKRGGGNVYFPFKSQAEWELATWMHDTGLTISDINAYLDLNQASPTWHIPILMFIHTSSIVAGAKPIIQDRSRITQTDRGASRSWHALVGKNNCTKFRNPLERCYLVLSESSGCNPMVAGSS
jgi:DNA-binding transcriptional MerR regulator